MCLSFSFLRVMAAASKSWAAVGQRPRGLHLPRQHWSSLMQGLPPRLLQSVSSSSVVVMTLTTLRRIAYFLGRLVVVVVVVSLNLLVLDSGSVAGRDISGTSFAKILDMIEDINADDSAWWNSGQFWFSIKNSNANYKPAAYEAPPYHKIRGKKNTNSDPNNTSGKNKCGIIRHATKLKKRAYSPLVPFTIFLSNKEKHAYTFFYVFMYTLTQA